MEKKLWFKAKTYGWGWTPSSWEGWLVTLVAVGLIVWHAASIDEASLTTASAIAGSFVPTLVIVAILLVICWKKGEKPRWRWGKNDKK